MTYTVETKKKYAWEEGQSKNKFKLNLLFPKKSDGTHKGTYMVDATHGRIFWEQEKAEEALESFLSLCETDERYLEENLWHNVYPELKDKNNWRIVHK